MHNTLSFNNRQLFNDTLQKAFPGRKRDSMFTATTATARSTGKQSAGGRGEEACTRERG